MSLWFILNNIILLLLYSAYNLTFSSIDVFHLINFDNIWLVPIFMRVITIEVNDVKAKHMRVL